MKTALFFQHFISYEIQPNIFPKNGNKTWVAFLMYCKQIKNMKISEQSLYTGNY